MLFFIRLYFKANQNKLAKLKLSLTHSLLGDAIVSQINVTQETSHEFDIQVLMMDKNIEAKGFSDLLPEDTDLTMFTIKNLNLVKKKQLVIMAIVLKRKVATELLTTYLPTILLLLITITTISFDKDLFSDVIAVNLTIMLVMTTIFTSKIEELPPTSDMKMIDIWLIFCLIVPFLEVILRTAIECLNCSCHICKQKDANKAKSKKEDKKKEGDAIQGVSYGEVTPVWVGTGAKVAPQQVTNYISE